MIPAQVSSQRISSFGLKKLVFSSRTQKFMVQFLLQRLEWLDVFEKEVIIATFEAHQRLQGI